MATIKLTAKRQATFPKDLCEEMRLQPGDALVVERKKVNGAWVWVLARAREPVMSWIGCLSHYGKRKHYDMETIRERIVEGMARGDLD